MLQIIKRLILYLLNYVRFLILSPLIISFFGTAVLALIFIADVYTPQGQSIQLPQSLKAVSPDTFHVTGQDVVTAWGTFSLVLYFLVAIIKKAFGIRAKLTTRYRIVIAAITYFILWIGAFIVGPIVDAQDLGSFLFVGVVFLISTLGLLLGYWVVSFLAKVMSRVFDMAESLEAGH